MGRHRIFSPEFKVRVVLEIITGAKRPSEVCREHRLKDSLVLKWRAAASLGSFWRSFASPDVSERSDETPCGCSSSLTGAGTVRVSPNWNGW